MDEIRRYAMQQLAIQEQDARQPRLAIEADGPANTKTREHTEGAATAVQAVHGDSYTTQKVQDGPKTSISFGVKAETPDLPSGKTFWSRTALRRPSCSPILGDAHNSSRRWLRSHRQNLHSYGDHLQRATFSVLRDRGDEFEEKKIMDFNSIRLVRQQLLETACSPLLPEGYRDKTDAKYDIRSRRFSMSSPRQPVLGILAHVTLW